MILRSLSPRSRSLAAMTTFGFVLLGSVPASAQKVTKTMAEYISAADQLCGASNAELEAAAKLVEKVQARSTVGGRIKNVKISVPKDTARFITETAVPTLTKLSTDLHTIPAPKGSEATVKDLLSSFDDGLAKLKAKPKASVYDDPMKPAAKAFVAAEFSACGHSASTPAKK